MKNYFKIALVALLFSSGIVFSAESACAYDDASGCMICSYQKVLNEPGACRDTGSDCPWSKCDGGSKE